MGITLAYAAKNTGHTPLWVSEGRSEGTRERAEKYGLEEKRTLQEFVASSDIIISVCPPAAASEVASTVAALHFSGIYADVNAISPQSSIEIQKVIEAGGGRYVDGGIIGLPAWKAGTTWLVLSGNEAETVASCFSAGPLQTEVLTEQIGQASALKMVFAANTKGTIALQCTVAAAAEKFGVRENLEQHWQRFFGEAQADKIVQGMRNVTAKAWRFSAEMDEIADTLESAGLPGGFHHASRDIYDRLAGFKSAEELPSLKEVLDTINQ